MHESNNLHCEQPMGTNIIMTNLRPGGNWASDGIKISHSCSSTQVKILWSNGGNYNKQNLTEKKNFCDWNKTREYFNCAISKFLKHKNQLSYVIANEEEYQWIFKFLKKQN